MPMTQSSVLPKAALGIEDVLERLVETVPAPEGDRDGDLQALIIDSWFDNYLGIVSLVRVINGALYVRVSECW